MLKIMGVALLLGIFCSTADQRSEARRKMRRYDRALWIASAALVALIALPEIVKRF